jgi:hypothetical protein
MAQIQLYAMVPILVTLPNGEREESCHLIALLLKGNSGGSFLVMAIIVDMEMRAEGVAEGLDMLRAIPRAALRKTDTCQNPCSDRTSPDYQENHQRGRPNPAPAQIVEPFPSHITV